jgi:CheY-like chemotaxis protein
MTLTSLLVCADEASMKVLRHVLDELTIEVELCTDPVRAGVRLAQDRFDLLILDCAHPSDVTTLLKDCHTSRASGATLAVVVVDGQEKIREMFSLGVNFVLYKPVSEDRAASTLRAAQAVLYRDKRRKARAAVHTQATIDYAGVEQAKATLVDLAEDGMAVNFGQKLPPTSKVYFQFRLPGQTATLRLSGLVVWQDWNGRAGVHFVDVPTSSRRLLHEWLQKNLADSPKHELASAQVDVQHSTQPSKEMVAAGRQEQKPQQPQFDAPDRMPQNVQENLQQNHKPRIHDHEAKARDKEAGLRLRAEPGNRRGQTRYACRLGAEVYQQGSSVRNYCHLSDLSPGGCYLEMPLAFQAGTPVEITVRTTEMKLRLSGEVKASHPGYGMGISFKLNTRDERHGVQQLIDFVAATADTST